MNKSSAIETLNRRGASPQLRASNTHFANISVGKPVWWIDIGRRRIFDVTHQVLNLALAEKDGRLHHLRIPKKWLIENIQQFAVRDDKDAISLELSALDHDRFTDVRPKSGRMRFVRFLAT